MLKVPYMLIIGEKEMSENKVSVRRQGKGDAGTYGLEEFTINLLEEIRERREDEGAIHKV